MLLMRILRIYDEADGGGKILTFGIVVISNGDGKRSLHGDFVLKHGCILMGNELPLEIHFSLESVCLVAELMETVL